MAKFDEVYRRLLETDVDGNYFEPLIGPTKNQIVFDWDGWRLIIRANGSWTYEETRQ